MTLNWKERDVQVLGAFGCSPWWSLSFNGSPGVLRTISQAYPGQFVPADAAKETELRPLASAHLSRMSRPCHGAFCFCHRSIGDTEYGSFCPVKRLRKWQETCSGDHSP